MFKIKVTKQEAINNEEKARKYCNDLGVAIIKSMDVLKQFDGKMINKRLLDAINTHYKSEGINCTVSFYEGAKGKKIKLFFRLPLSTI